jgi:hypothetical protein
MKPVKPLFKTASIIISNSMLKAVRHELKWNLTHYLILIIIY